MASVVSESLTARLPQEDEPNVTNTNAPLTPGNSATISLPDTKLICVEYPGVVVNVDKMLDTIGGERGVSKVNVSVKHVYFSGGTLQNLSMANIL